MRAARCERYGGPSEIVVRDVPDPSPRAQHVVVSVDVAAVNFPDVLTIADLYQISTPVPFTPGSEFAGRVLSVGDQVEGIAPGDRVMGSCGTGAFAERIEVPASTLAKVPKGLDMVRAAAFQVTYLTAYHALVTTGGVRRDDWVVVLGAAGGVGTATVDIATRLGARVIAAASSSERLKLCGELGAVEGIDYSQEDLKPRIKEITGGGADLVVDPVGGAHAEPALRAIRWGGQFVSVGFASGDIPRIPLNVVLLKNIIVRGVELRSLNVNLPEAVESANQALGDLVADGMSPLVSEIFTLEETSVALDRVASRRATGKVVIRVGTAD